MAAALVHEIPSGCGVSFSGGETSPWVHGSGALLWLPKAPSPPSVFPAALDFPKFVPKVDVVADCSAAKVSGGSRTPGGAPALGAHPGALPFALQSAVGAGYQTLRIARALRRCRELLARALHWVM